MFCFFFNMKLFRVVKANWHALLLRTIFHLSSGVSTWKVLSITVVHCRHLIMNVLGFGRSVFISWHSIMEE